jgi:hypothetical protein
MIKFASMTGVEIYKRDAAVYNTYAKLLQTLRLHLGEAVVYKLLERAEAQGKKLAIDPLAPVELYQDDIAESSIIFV